MGTRPTSTDLIPSGAREVRGVRCTVQTRTKAKISVGKPFEIELDRLPETYAWSHRVPLGDLPRALRRAAGLPLLAVGSGGSYTTAQLAAAAHRQFGASHASAMTPLEAVATPESLRHSTVMLVTASGRNQDVLGSFERLAEREPRQFVVLCARAGSPLGSVVRKHPEIDLAEFELPSGKDGFLATNSLLASAVILIRGYEAAFSAPPTLPKRFVDLLGQERDTSVVDRLCRPLWQRQTLVVLYGPQCHAAAVDLESKFSEAALGNVQISDFRNFAHGRHHWLAKRGGQSAVLAFVSDEDRSLADALLTLIPKDVPVVRFLVSGTGLTANLAALLKVFMIVGSAGKTRGIDPGDPGVPLFGRKIYHLRAFAKRRTALPPREKAAIERKSGATVTSLISRGAIDEWRAAYCDFCERLRMARFRGVVLDYDGTLCSETNRFKSLPSAIARQLNRLMRAGIVLGVATGRGKSVKKTLREAITPRYWKNVIVGYYNGGDVSLLTDDTRPDGTDDVGPALSQVAKALRTTFDKPELVKLTFRPTQITIEPGPEANAEDVWNSVQPLICAVGGSGVFAVRSSHSMDVMSKGVTKLSVVDHVIQRLSGSTNTPVLCIGDRGRWPGNDYALLSTPYALSVDEVSPDTKSGWNLSAPGRRGEVATLDYLESLAETRVGMRLLVD